RRRRRSRHARFSLRSRRAGRHTAWHRNTRSHTRPGCAGQSSDWAASRVQIIGPRRVPSVDWLSLLLRLSLLLWVSILFQVSLLFLVSLLLSVSLLLWLWVSVLPRLSLLPLLPVLRRLLGLLTPIRIQNLAKPQVHVEPLRN